MPLQHDDYLVDLLLRTSAISQEQLQNAQEVGQLQGQGIAHALIEQKIISQENIFQLIAEDFELEYCDQHVEFDPDLLSLFPKEELIEQGILPLRQQNGVMHIAVANPLDFTTVDRIEHRFGKKVERIMMPRQKIETTLQHYYSSLNGADSQANIPSPEIKLANDSITHLFHRLVDDAISARATDIHIEPMRDCMKIRYRIDGKLLDISTLPKHLQIHLTNRIKISAHLNIAEKRLPQDGKIFYGTLENQKCELRISTIPNLRGEDVAIRLLGQQHIAFDLAQLGFSKNHREQLQQAIQLPDGIIIATGPTGSGKTTTLYSLLQLLNKPERKIITVEDPIECRMHGVNQTQVHPSIGMTFATALRSILRQSPNVIMIGEIRDRETAEIVFQAALTGHLILTTLHTNDAWSAITRLVDIGINSHLIASSLRMVIAQRLIRKICPVCKNQGCETCHHTGFMGRTGIFELLKIDSNLQNILYDFHANSNRTSSPISLNMQNDGLEKVAQQITTIEEVSNVTAYDDELSF